jgi:hypothetical protein
MEPQFQKLPRLAFKAVVSSSPSSACENTPFALGFTFLACCAVLTYWLDFVTVRTCNHNLISQVSLHIQNDVFSHVSNLTVNLSMSFGSVIASSRSLIERKYCKYIRYVCHSLTQRSLHRLVMHSTVSRSWS